MEETQSQHKLYGFLQCGIYLMVVFEILIFVHAKAPFLGLFAFVVDKRMLIPVYQSLLFSKLSTLILICLVSIGRLAKKKPDFDPRISMIYPLLFGLLLFFSGLWLCVRPSALVFAFTTWFDYLYMVSALLGALLISLSLDIVSKMIRSGLGKDKWNVEQESFMQSVKLVETDCSVNIPMQFYYKGKVRDGWINLTNVYKSMMVVGVPRSGKTWSVVNPAIRQLMAKSFTMVLYDFKFPDLGKILYYHYLLARSGGRCLNYGFHVINLTSVVRSRRINVFKRKYITPLADAAEAAEGLVEAMKKGDKSGGADQFFTQSAINFLGAMYISYAAI